MARIALIMLLILPVIEIALIIAVGQSIGLLPTLALLLGAGILGAVLLRQQGLDAVMRMRRDISARRVPARAMADAMMVGIAAVLLVVPGFMSDIVAIGLLLPPVRVWIYGAIARKVVVVTPSTQPAPPDTIELPPEDFRPR